MTVTVFAELSAALAFARALVRPSLLVLIPQPLFALDTVPYPAFDFRLETAPFDWTIVQSILTPRWQNIQ